MSGFAAVVDEFWGASEATGEVVHRDASLVLVIDPTVDASAPVSIVRRIAGATTVTLSPLLGEQLEVRALHDVSEAGILSALSEADVQLHDADNLYYFGDAARAQLAGHPNAVGVRQLSASDAAAFERFESQASEQDREDAFVELDHWTVFGAFEGELLVAAASAYPWHGSRLADIGVLTLPEFRGRGHARAVVRALARAAITAGYEPQYRCQLDNAGSIALAASAGLTSYGTWQTVSPDARP